jgi:hypothetical protein
VTNIGFINKYKSRQHLILLLSLGSNADVPAIEYLAKQIESFFFFSSTLRIQAKTNESLFVQWAEKLRNLTTIDEIACVIEKTRNNFVNIDFIFLVIKGSIKHY